MKVTATVKAFLLFLIIGIGTAPATAQFGDAGEILRAGAQDANLLLKEYLKPVGKGFGSDLNSGWFSTAGTHGTLGFDLTVNASMAVVPGADQVMNLNNLTFNDLECISGCSNSPTVIGEENAGARVGSQTYYTDQFGNQRRLYEFDLPQGFQVPMLPENALPSMMIQASVGLIKSTDITVRYMPTVNYSEENLKFDLFGVGIKHEINQWLPGGSMLPVDISLQGGFTKMSASAGFDVRPDEDSDTENPYPASTWDGQKAEFSSNAFTLNALVGKTLPFISIFGGVGYQTSTVKVGTPGSYPVTSVNPDFDPTAPSGPGNQPKIIEKFDEPVDLTYDDNSNFHALVGTRIRLMVLNISATYTISKYPVAQVGVGIGFR